MDANDLTFLLTDIEGSTRLWNAYPDTMFGAVAQHNLLLSAAVEKHRGTVFKDTGDGMWASFADASDAVASAVASQLALGNHDWDQVPELRVRMSLHRGWTIARKSDYCGQTMNLTARLNGLAHGGQVLITDAVVQALDAPYLAQHSEVSFVDLGLHRLRDLPDPVQIHQVVHPLLRSETRLLVDPTEERDEIPEPARPLRGREAAVASVTALVEATQLVTLTGAPGIGKTRLAVRVANVMRHRFPAGAAFIDASFDDEESLLLEIVSALAIYRPPSAALRAVLSDYLRSHPTLLVIDGAERCVTVVGEVVTQLLDGSPDSRIVVTSTEALRVRAERTYVVGSLACTAGRDSMAPAVQLLLDIAAEFGARAPLDDEVSVLVELCAAVDGLPLAIELLGTQLAVQSPHALRKGLTTFDIAGPLKTVLQDSIERLSTASSQLLDELSMLAGTFTLETIVAISTVCAGSQTTAASLLAELQRHSLVSRIQSNSTEVWFRVLEPIRRHVRASLPGPRTEVLQETQALKLAALAVLWAEKVRGRDEVVWAEIIEGHFVDIGRSFDWLLGAKRFDVAQRVVSNLWDFAHTRMRPEVWLWADKLLMVEGPGADPDSLGVAALGAWMRGEGDEALRLADLAVAIEKDLGVGPTVPARLALLDAHSYATEAMQNETRDLAWAWVDLFEAAKTGDAYWAVNSRVIGAVGLSMLEEGDGARQLADEGLELGRASKNPSTLAWALFGAAVAYEAIDEPLAEAYADESVRVARSVGNQWVESLASGLLVTLKRRVSGGRSAIPLLRDLLSRWERTAHTAQQWHAVRSAALVLLQAGSIEMGIELLTAAQRATLAMPLLPSERQEVEAIHRTAAGQLDEPTLARAVARGQVADLALVTERATAQLTLLL